MTLQQAIKKYNLIKQEKDFTDAKYPKNYICYFSKKETDKALYYYTADKDMDFCNRFFLTVQTFYKNTNKNTIKIYILEG